MTKASANIRVGIDDRDVVKGLKSLETKFSRSATEIRSAIGLISGALGTLQKVFGGIIDLAEAQVAAEKKYVSALSARNQATVGALSVIQRFNAAVQASTGVGDELLLVQQATSISMGVAREDMQLLTKAAVGMSAAMGIPLEQAFRKASQVILGNVNAMKEYGISGTRESILQQLASQFTVAEDASRTFAGQMNILKGVFSDAMESMGRKFTENEFIIDGLTRLSILLPLLGSTSLPTALAITEGVFQGKKSKAKAEEFSGSFDFNALGGGGISTIASLGSGSKSKKGKKGREFDQFAEFQKLQAVDLAEENRLYDMQAERRKAALDAEFEERAFHNERLGAQRREALEEQKRDASLFQQFQGAAAAGLGNIIQGMAENVGNGKSIVDDFGGLLGGFISNMGSMLIQLGTAALLANALSFIPFLTPLVGKPGVGAVAGVAAIAAGAAMVAAGTAMGGASRATNTGTTRPSASSGGFSGSNSFSPGGQNGGQIVYNISFGSGVIMGSPQRLARELREALKG